MEVELRRNLHDITRKWRMIAYEHGNHAIRDVCDEIDQELDMSLPFAGVVGENGKIFWANGEGL